MKNKFLPLFIISIFIIIFIIFYKSLKEVNIYTPDLKVNNNIPSFSAELFYSKKIVNSSKVFSTKKFYLLNIWSSWCAPCRQEHPLLIDLTKDKKIILVGINYKDTKENAKNFLKELGNPYDKIIFDKEGINSIELGAYGVPESFLIHRGIIKKRYIGPLNNNSVNEIKSLIR